MLNNQHILIVIDSLGAGGAEKVTLNLSAAFSQEHYSVDIIVIDDIIEYEIEENITVFKLGFEKGVFDYYRNRRRLHKMVDNLQKHKKYNRIIVHLQKSTRLMKGYAHPKVIHVVHSTLSQASLSNRTGLRRFLKLQRLKSIYDGLTIVTVSQGIADDIKALGLSPKKLTVIYNPVDVATLVEKSQASTDCSYDDDYIVYVGRLAASKRHDRALEAYQKSHVDASFLIVGDGDMREKIAQNVVDLGLQDRVEMCGYQSNPYPIIKNAKLLVLTSDYEGLPTVLIEALALGVPVVSVDCPSGPREILGAFMPKSLVPLDDQEALVNAIQKHLSQKQSIPKALVARFDPKHIVLQYLKV